jgi:hypothetical protein
MAKAVTMPSGINIPAAARVWFYALTSLVPLLWLLWQGQTNLLVTLLVSIVMIGIALARPELGICLTIAYLFLLGDIRRIPGMFLGFPAFDTLLLVGPLLSVILAVPLLIRVRLEDSISKAVLTLMVVMTLEIFNPRQGPVTVGLAGAMFYLVPMLWFWIGRRYGTDKVLFAVLYRIVFPLGVLAAALGLCQTYVGFLPWESAWVAAVIDHYHALNLGGGFIRAFGFSVNGVEYADLLLVTSAFTLAAFFAGKRVYGLFFPLVATALFLASSRSAIVKLLFSVAISWALSNRGGRGWTVRLSIGLAVGFGALALALSQIGGGDATGKQTSSAQASTQHQVGGLSHPFDKKYSTAGMHSEMFAEALIRGFANPIGNGLGSTTLGLKFSEGSGSSDEKLGSSEIDISDAFLSMGFIGGLTYLATIILVLRRAIIFGRSSAKHLALPVLGILAAMGGGWIALGQYGIAPLVWFVIGALSRPRPYEITAQSAKRPAPARLRTQARGASAR